VPELYRTGTGTAHEYVVVMKLLGIVLIVLGVLALAYGGFSYTKEKKVLDVGPLQATTRTHETVPIPPIVGGGAVIAGIAVLALSARHA
jgi:uncharacterized membrane protein YidH (DUF202 family)